MYFLKKRPLKKPRLKIPNTHYKFNKIYYTRLNRLPDEILRNIYQFIFPIRDIKQVKSLWCNSCGEHIPDYETCIKQNNNYYSYIQISSYEKSTHIKLHCIQCFISEIYPEWESSTNLLNQNNSLRHITIL